MYLYLRENPRTLYLVTSQQDERHGRPSRSLVFRAAEGRSAQAVVEFLPKDEVDLSNAVKVTSRVVKGCLGLIAVSGGECRQPKLQSDGHSLNPLLDIFLAAIVSATEVGNTRPSGPQPEAIAKIHEVAFYSLTSSTWDDLIMASEALSGHAFPDQSDPMYREQPYYQSNASSPSVLEHPCAPLAKILSAGTFYFALEPHWDLSSRLSQRLERDEAAAKDLATYDDRFVWNDYIVHLSVTNGNAFRNTCWWVESECLSTGSSQIRQAVNLLRCYGRATAVGWTWETISNFSPETCLYTRTLA